MIAASKRKKLIDLVENSNNESLFNSLWESANKFLESYNTEIDAAMDRIEDGDFMTQEEVDGRLEVWASK